MILMGKNFDWVIAFMNCRGRAKSHGHASEILSADIEIMAHRSAKIWRQSVG
jgi:hypothetical protein